MTPPLLTRVLTTGANSGIGFECARQLALHDGVTTVILGCRNQEKAQAAKKELETLTGKTETFEILIIDTSNLESVRNAVQEVSEPIDGLVLNAGGQGGSDPLGLTEYGVTNSIATNLLGHVFLVDLLLEQKKLTGSVIFSGSEAATGIPSMGVAPPVLQNGSVEEFTTICDGSFFKTPDAVYGHSKMMAALWMSSMARKEPTTRFVTMSPGMTAGTAVMKDLPFIKRILTVYLIMPLMSLLGTSHTVEVGAKRYMDALLDHDRYKTGVFYASKDGLSGVVSDQSTALELFSNETYQENANAAIHKFIK